MKTFKTHIKETLVLSFPVIIGQLGSVLMGAQDNIMIGWVSELHLSASALANSLYFIIFVIGVGISMVVAPLVSESIGAETSADSGQYLKQGLWAVLLAGLGLSLAIEGLVWALPYMGQPAEEVVLAVPYLRVLNLGTLPMLFFLVYKQFCDGWSATRVGMYVTLIGLAANFVLNYIFIFLLGGELVGAAWATVLSKFLMFGAIAWRVHRKPNFQPIISQASNAISWAMVRKILQMGLPTGMQIFFELIAFGGATIMIGWLENATIARAAHQIAIGTAAITFMCCSGLAAGASVRVGNYFGSKEPLEMRKAAQAALLLTVLMMSFFSVLLLVFQQQIPLWYGAQDSQVIALTASLCVYAAAFQLFDGTQSVAAGILRGMQDVRFPTWVTLFGYTIICAPMSYILAFEFDFGVYGFWWGFVICLTGVACLLVFRIFRVLQLLFSESE